ncbi:50S ribosomal protein L5 [Candidatus Woesebacteria bacterium]|nr:50S ribosomal protein L5 [Candidatus Woesebacteria bacterium]
MQRLNDYYTSTILSQLKTELGITNDFAVPRLKKIVINSGITNPVDPRARKPIAENFAQQLSLIAGQKAQVSIAKKSIAGFKLREGDPLGAMVTLRGDHMWEFLEKLITVALPRVKDFRGVSRTAFDGHGNYSLGLEEQSIFPEIDYDTMDSVRGMQIVFVTTARTNEHAFRLLELLGMPFAREN